ncbi:MAG: GDP-mannose 4,6-dehydratase [Parasutterella sp.]
MRLSWEDPISTAEVNVFGIVNLLRNEIFGTEEQDNRSRFRKNAGFILAMIRFQSLPANPCNFYAVTKACQNMISQVYANGFNLPLVLTRTFNHFGPGQKDTFVVPSFCKQIAEIEILNKEPIINVGNLEAYRDFTDVRDVARAYVHLAMFGRVGEVYNVGGGKPYSIKEILDILLSFSAKKIKVVIDEKKFRPIDSPYIVADISKIKKETSWEPIYSIKTGLKDTLDYWREKTYERGRSSYR